MFTYNPETGILTRKPTVDSLGRIHTQFAGQPAGTLHVDGQIQVTIQLNLRSVFFAAHRIAWAMRYGQWPEFGVDHQDRVRSHNWIKNLRSANQSQNNCNKAISTRKDRTSKYKGVYLHKRGKWGVQIKIEGKSVWFGLHNSELEAASVYDKEVIKLHGEFACTNKMLGLL